MIHLFDITPTGSGTINALLLLLLLVDPASTALIEGQVNEYMSKFKGRLKNKKEVKEMLTWILDDKFKEETYKMNMKIHNTDVYINELGKLKENMINFYFRNLQELQLEDSNITMSCDIHSTMGIYVLQLMRLRMVIEPEINLLTNPHLTNSATGERTLYLTAKAFWMGDDGKKVRKFTKSLGLMSEYDGKREGIKAKEESVRRLQPMLWDEYRATYP